MKTLYYIFTLVLFFSYTQLVAQKDLLVPLNSSHQEVGEVLDRFPDLRKTNNSNMVVYGNRFFKARYQFKSGRLKRAHISHQFDSAEMAKSELEGYVKSFQNAGATVIPMFKENKTAIYFVYQGDEQIELFYRNQGRKKHEVTVKSHLPEDEDRTMVLSMANTK